MSQELKYKVGDRVKVINPKCTNFGETGLVIQITHLGNWSYRLVLPNGEEAGWFGSEDLTRAASSPGEQDIENAGGSDAAPKTRCRCQEPPTAMAAPPEPDAVNHPSHYTSDPSGVECITITRHRDFLVGNAIKYLWRAGLKESDNPGKEVEDLQKSIWYIQQRIELITH